MLQRIVPFGKISEFFLNGIASLAEDHRTTILLAGALLCKCFLLAFLYRQKAFLRL
jgi:hypothetical protein